MQSEAHEAAESGMQDELDRAQTQCQVLQSTLTATSDELSKSSTHLQVAKLDMTYLKVRRQLSQTPAALSYVQAYQVSCEPAL